ncbi:MAG: SUMF1/EgtB/PvdO family nonheme iron enzyme [Deltaproteobacteria bacterium]|nr:SUMF1/EgtB/PvdO family nonheme iron enzyme [Deltaproteobacteria bacterium]
MLTTARTFIALSLAGCWALGCGGSVTEGHELGGPGGSSQDAAAGGSTGSAGGSSSGGSGGAGAACGACGAELEQCWNQERCVAKLVPVAGGFSIDATEVTRSQYQAWLDTKPSTSAQPPYCSWNSTFEPDSVCMMTSVVCKGQGCGRHPQVCMDWCDAYVYCAASGKRLCGKIGGGPAGFYDAMIPAADQWHNACTSGGLNDYTYGNTYAADTCNGAEHGVNTTVEVGSMPGCTGADGYAGVFDLTGNVVELEDACDSTNGPDDDCRLRGGSFGAISQVRCDFPASGPRDRSEFFIGWRCCGLP